MDWITNQIIENLHNGQENLDVELIDLLDRKEVTPKMKVIKITYLKRPF